MPANMPPARTNGMSETVINQDAELRAISKVIKTFEDGSRSVVDKLSVEIATAQKKLQEQERIAKEELYKKIGELHAKGLIDAEAQALAYAQSEEQKRYNDRLKSEIEILQYISAENQAEQNKKRVYLEMEKQILELRAQGNEDEAKQKEKELAVQKKKDKREQDKKDKQEETLSYEFGDKIKESFSEFTDALNDENHAKKVMDENLVNAMKGVGKAIEDGLNAINNAISEYAKYQAGINARLQGVSSYSSAVKTLSAVAYSPLLKAEDLYANLADLVGQGIVTNVEQRAMFATMKDSIAGTFDVTSDSLKRLIRIQQNDSTAARLGMEAYLTRFLNVYVQNTEYLQSTFDTVSNSLLEASAMMHLNSQVGASASAELEYVIQKWLGTLSGVGLSDTAAQSIADAIGQLGSGNIDALSSSDIQNLIVMASSKVGLNYGEMLNTGVTAKQANDLMLGVVQYLQDVAASGTNVVKSQLANIFGVTVSDLVAVSNLSNDAMNTVHKDMLSYKNMYGELTSQFKELPSRLGISNILENLFSNLTYQTGMGIASNPVTYALWKITDMIQSVTGGIAVPFISAFGNGFDLNTTVENLMKIAVVGVSTLGNIGKIASGLASIGDGSVLLKKLKVSEGEAKVKSFGGSLTGANGGRGSGSTTSETTIVGNNDGDTYSDSAQNEANDGAQKDLDKKSSEYEDPVVKYFDEELKLATYLEDSASKIDNILESQNSIIAGIERTAGAAEQIVGSSAGSFATANDLKAISSTIAAATNLLVQLVQAGLYGGAYGGGTTGGFANDAGAATGGATGAVSGTEGTQITGGSNSSLTASYTSNSYLNSTAGGGVSGLSMESYGSDLTYAAVSALILDIIEQQQASQTGLLEVLAPMSNTLDDISVHSLASIGEISALNGCVVAGMEDICEKLQIVLEAKVANIDSAYSNYTDSVSQDIDTTYSTIAGDVSTQVEVIKDLVDANISQDDNGNVNIDVMFTPPDIYVDNAIDTPTPEVTFNPEINVENPNVTFNPEINVANPDIAFNPEINNNINVTSPDIVLDPQIENNITQPDINLNPEIINTVPNVNIDNEIVNTPPEISVDNNITNETPPVIVNNEIINKAPEINLVNNIITPTPEVFVDVKNEVVTQAPQIINTVNFNPNILNELPEIVFSPEIINMMPEVVVNPEIINNVPNVIVDPEITVVSSMPDVNVSEDITVTPPDVQVSPNVEVINTVPNVNVEPNIINEVSMPEISVSPEVVFTVPNIVVNNDFTNEIPEVNVQSNLVLPDAANQKLSENTDPTEYEKYLFENGIVNNIASSASASTHDVSDYLISIDFADGFKLLVDSVSKIKTLIEESSDNDSLSGASDEDISGFTVYTFNK